MSDLNQLIILAQPLFDKRHYYLINVVKRMCISLSSDDMSRMGFWAPQIRLTTHREARS
jgi:hypothetical protein